MLYTHLQFTGLQAFSIFQSCSSQMLLFPYLHGIFFPGTAALNPKSQGRISLVSVSFIAIANTIPPIIGAAVVLILNPGA